MNEDNTLCFEARGPQAFTIRIGHRDCSELLDFETLIECRNQAQAEIEELTATLATALDDEHQTSLAGWLCTPDYRRPDDFQGLFGWLYLFAVAKQLVQSGVPAKAVLARQTPDWAARRLEAEGFQVTRPRPDWRKLIRRFRPAAETWQSLRFVANFGIHDLRNRKRQEPLGDQGVQNLLLKAPPEGIEARYGPLSEALDTENWRTTRQNFDLEDRRTLPGSFWQLLAWQTAGMVLAALVDAHKLKRRLARLRTVGKNSWLNASPALAPSIYALARRMLQWRLWNAALNDSRPKAAVLVSSLNRPEDRLLITCLKRHDIPVALVLPRPINPDRPAEKLIEADLNHPETLPDHFVVRDEQSRTALRAQGIKQEQIAVGLPALQQQSSEATRVAEGTRILVLLTVLQHVNTCLCRMLADALESRTDLQVIVRCHPNLPLGQAEREQLDRLQCQWQEQNDSPIAEQAGNGTIAITATSTAAIEAARYGAAVLWAPFISEIALFQHRFMQQVGRIAQSQEELVAQLRNLCADQSGREDLARQCRESAAQHFSADTSISQALIEWLQATRKPQPLNPEN